jgi:hypothetical protein
MGAVKSMCQWVVLMDQGRVLEQGTAEQVADDVPEAREGARQRAAVGDQPRTSEYPRWGSGRSRGTRGRAARRATAGHARRADRRPYFDPHALDYAHRDTPNPVFGLGLYRSDGTYLNGSNHHWREEPLELGAVKAGERVRSRSTSIACRCCTASTT